MGIMIWGIGWQDEQEPARNEEGVSKATFHHMSPVTTYPTGEGIPEVS